MRFPGGAALHCWGGGAAETASSEKADGSLVTKVNLFYNGCYTHPVDPCVELMPTPAGIDLRVFSFLGVKGDAQES